MCPVHLKNGEVIAGFRGTIDEDQNITSLYAILTKKAELIASTHIVKEIFAGSTSSQDERFNVLTQEFLNDTENLAELATISLH